MADRVSTNRSLNNYPCLRRLHSWDKVVFGLGLISTVGAQHRKQRKVLNPVFSMAHMRHMTPIFYSIGERVRLASQHLDGPSRSRVLQLVRSIEAQLQGGKKEVDMLNWMSRAALELIGQGGLGYSFDPLTEDRMDEFANAVKEFL